MKLIDKDALVAEIERRRDAALMRQRNLETIGDESILNELIADGLNRLIAFIDTIEVKEEELTEFEKALARFAWRGINVNDLTKEAKKILHKDSKRLLDLARKELQPEIDKELDKAYKTRDEIVYLEGYDKGKEDARKIPSNPDYETLKNELAAYVENVRNEVESEESLDYWTDRLYKIAKEIALKDLPRWKKSDRYIECGVADFFFTLEDDGTISPYFSTEIEEGQYYISEQDLLNLPKEE